MSSLSPVNLKAVAITAAIGLTSTAAVSGFFLLEKIKRIKAESVVSTLNDRIADHEANKKQLESVINGQQIVNETLSKSVKEQTKIIEAGQQLINEANDRSDATIQKYNTLRAGELNRATKDPYAAGLAADDRIANSVWRIFERTPSGETEIRGDTEDAPEPDTSATTEASPVN